MRINLLIGGKAGQGINKVTGIITKAIIEHGYFIFNYRDYPSIIRGGHNFNIISISDRPIRSHESRMDGIIALDGETRRLHEDELKKGGFVIDYSEFPGLGINLNIALCGALMRRLGIEKENLLDSVKEGLKDKDSLKEAIVAAKQGYESQETRYHLRKLKRKPILMSGSKAAALGAINSKIDIYIAYPMTPATNLLNELAERQVEGGYVVYQPEGEIAAINMALGASFAGAKAIVGTSGGGFDLMGEGLSMQGASQLPLVVYLASRVGPGTGIPTYTMQCDMNIALKSGHGEFPRIVIAPGDPVESIEKVNEAFYLANKFNSLAIILTDKHIAESEFSSLEKPKKPLDVKVKRKIPGEMNVKASSYEHDLNGLTTESASFAIKNAEERLWRYEEIKKECKRFEMVKTYGRKKSRNLIISWGSPTNAIIDAIEGLDYKLLQVIYIKPLSDKVKEEILKAKNVTLIENNLTGQLGRLIREKTGIKIKKRILKYDGRPFTSDELREMLR